MTFKTPDQFPGVSIEEGQIFEDVGVVPTQQGEVRYLSGSFIMSDSLGAFNPRHTGSTFDEQQHEGLYTLTHFQTMNTFDEVIYTGLPRRISNVISWDSPSKIRKVREQRYIYTQHRVTQLIDAQYDAIGTLKYVLTESVSYVDSLSFYVSNINRTRN
jgi:hypothetical protein